MPDDLPKESDTESMSEPVAEPVAEEIQPVELEPASAQGSGEAPTAHPPCK